MFRRMKTLFLFVLGLLGVSCTGKSQLPANMPHSQNPKFDSAIINTLDFTVPVISVDELHARKQDFVILDAREKKEFDVSRIPGAQWVGYDDFKMDRLKGIDKDKPVLLYCSIGYRSEKIGERLKDAGYTQVYNLYGSIFEWANKGYPVVNEKGDTVNTLHTYNWFWGRWVDGSRIKKVH